MTVPRAPALRAAAGFVLLSGTGWLCDMLSFALLVHGAGLPADRANMVSSMVGVTLVWFLTLSTVFRRSNAGQAGWLLLYWTYQLVSIYLYSQLLLQAAAALPAAVWLGGHQALAAKIVVTPFNLATNFLFMALLTRRMRHAPTDATPSVSR